ncbi:ABC transporter substrate-binding protein [Variovorax sp. UC122_21]|uniref:ABC transporter substrate-binding protein n=1 Tax=Variovorax sp. UC122_21 TaxID=3374554 RepID=UPI0037579B48
MPAAANAADPVKVGSIFDLTGGLNIYGLQQSRALRLAVDDINAQGGLLGRTVEVVQADAQSELDKYPQYANTMVMRDRVAALFGGLTSSAREAVRPVARRSNTLYFYSSLYEGGVCDSHTFLTGPSASQQLSVLIRWAVQRYGKRIYVMAADYNFGTISAAWVREYARQAGAEVVGVEFLPLTVTDYSSTIQKIEAARPSFVFALPVGANQTGFMEQFAAAGLGQRMGIVSTNFGSGNQQIVVSPRPPRASWCRCPTSSGSTTRRTRPSAPPGARPTARRSRSSRPRSTCGTPRSCGAAAVRKAGAFDTAKVRAALESGLELKAPNGPVALVPRSHHLRQSMYIAQGNAQRGFDLVAHIPDVEPVYENERCDLLKQPAQATQFTPAGT